MGTDQDICALLAIITATLATAIVYVAAVWWFSRRCQRTSYDRQKDERKIDRPHDYED